MIGCILGLAACSSSRLWPFGSGEDTGRSTAPANATQYRCNGGKSFYLRFLASGEAWVIVSEREFRLDKVEGASGRRFSNGGSTLDLGTSEGAEASMNDGATNLYAGCKIAGRE